MTEKKLFKKSPIKCKECGALIKISNDVELNEIVQCMECGTEFEVLAVKPIKLAKAPMEEEDWGE